MGEFAYQGEFVMRTVDERTPHPAGRCKPDSPAWTAYNESRILAEQARVQADPKLRNKSRTRKEDGDALSESQGG